MNYSDKHRITIDRWRITYLAPDGEPFPDDFRYRLDDLFRSEVAEACDRRLHLALDPADPSVWRIRRLGVDLSVNPTHRLFENAPSFWGAELASCIGQTLARGEDSESVIRFANRAAYLAQFARDLAAGRAWGKWYYQEFESLSVLAPSRGICEALTQNPADASAAILALMNLNHLHDILRVLTRADAHRLFEACRQSATGSAALPDGRPVDILLQLWSETPFRSNAPDDNPDCDALWWLAIAGSRYPGAENDRELLSTIAGLLDLRRVLSAIPSNAIRERIVHDLASHNFSSALRLAIHHGVPDSASALDLLAGAMRDDVHWANEALGILLTDQDYRRTSPAIPPLAYGPPVPATFAGVFRLGPSFLATGILDILDGLPNPASAAFLLHLLAIKCLGGERAESSSEDVALKTFSGLRSRFSAALDDHGFLPDFDLAAAHRTLLASLTAAGRCEGRAWLADVLATPNGRVLILRDAFQDEWISAALLPEHDVARVTAETLAVAAAFASNPESPNLFWRGIHIEPALPAELESVGLKSVRGLRPIDRDLAYFSFHELLPQLDPAVDLFLTLAARAILRHFARRLPGFGSSSPEHLYRNFLSGAGFLRDAGDKLEVELPSVPLSLVLRLAGIQDETYSMPWQKGREVCILRWTE